jgi:hypothetical protein
MPKASRRPAAPASGRRCRSSACCKGSKRGLTNDCNRHHPPIAAPGMTSAEEIAAELTKRGIEPPTTDDAWTAEDVRRVFMSDAWRRAGLLPSEPK